MLRSVVLRFEENEKTNVNDEIGLEPYADYTLGEYLEDRATDGAMVLATHGNVFAFSDGTTEILQQRMERIPVDRLDEETRSVVVDAAAMRLMPYLSSVGALLPVC